MEQLIWVDYWTYFKQLDQPDKINRAKQSSLFPLVMKINKIYKFDPRADHVLASTTEQPQFSHWQQQGDILIKRFVAWDAVS